MVLTTSLIIGGAVVIAGRKTATVGKINGRLASWRSTLVRKIQRLEHSERHVHLTTLTEHSANVAITAAERRLNKELLFSSTSLAVTILGSLVYPPLQLLSLPSVIYSLLPIYRDAYHSVRAKQFDVNVLYAITQSLVVGRGYLLPANLGAFYYFLSRKLLLMAEDRFEIQLHELFGQLPLTVHKIVNGVEVDCNLEEIAIGDVITVYAGETIPVDGTIISGMAMVDQQRLTGEAQSVEKGDGETLYASTILLAGSVQIQVTQAGTTTIVAQIGTILAQSTAEAVDHELWSKQLNDRLVFPLVALGGLSLPVLGLDGAQALIDSHPQRRMNISTALCALNYLALAADSGILVKNGRALERLHLVDTIVFDKTGTLTLDQPYVAQIYAAPGFNPQIVLRYAAAAEAHQEHPIARAISEAAQAQGIQLPHLDDAAYHVGYGLTVQIGEHQIRVGSDRFIEQEGISIPAQLQQQLTTIWRQGNSGVLVSVDGQVAGLIELHATLRPEAAAIMAMIRRQGLQSYVLSGDHEAPTRRLADELEIEHYVADLLPEEKAAFVARLQAENKHVCFIGDGINDAIAMQQADVAISLRGATTAATDTAHIVLMAADLQQLFDLFAITRDYRRNQRATVGVFLTGTTIAVSGAYFLGFGLWHVTNLNMLFFPMSLAIAMWPRLVGGR